ncbi:MAG: DUF58 domain-containing protein [Proteobacteria bacterium]|nr:MAG: DUF58 domain-containing protein [Pseudomonadota bacterium]
MAMTHGPIGTPILQQLTPFHPLEPSHQKYVSVARFHGTQKLNLMRPTRLPANSRRYTAGDPVHLIDWRAYARNEQLVLREQNDEASCKVHIFIDIKESMQWPDASVQSDRPMASKQEIAWRVALNLSYQFFRWGDQVKVWVVQGTKAHTLRMRSQSDAAIQFEKLSGKGFQINDKDLVQRRDLKTFRDESSDLLYWISDGFQGVPDWINSRGLVCWLQILSSLEIDTNWLDPITCYFDEGRVGQEFMGASLIQNNNLHAAVHEWMQRTADEWLKIYTHHLVLTDQTPIQQFIFALEQPWLRGMRGRT